jgi:hypothetical protein
MRCEMFEVAIEEDLQKPMEETIHHARVSLTEHYLLEGVIGADKALEASKSAINAQIKAWSDLNIVSDNINARLWDLAQAVTKGKPLKR